MRKKTQEEEEQVTEEQGVNQESETGYQCYYTRFDKRNTAPPNIVHNIILTLKRRKGEKVTEHKM